MRNFYNTLYRKPIYALMIYAGISLVCIIMLLSCYTHEKQVELPEEKPPVAATPEPTVSPMPSVSPSPSPTMTPDTVRLSKLIDTAVAANSCAKYSWKERGKAPMAYTKGMVYTFARSVCDIKLPHIAEVAKANTGDDVKDAISWHNSNFKSLGMDNSKAGLSTLRHSYVLLIGLGMRESSGQFCCGRDMSANFSSSDSAEAGLFQSSWGARRASNLLPELYTTYKSGKRGCFSDVFKKDISCTPSDLKNWGSGDGADFQKLSKDCPAFATEYAAILLRDLGGTKGEFGPLRRKEAEIRPECDELLSTIQEKISSNPALCDQLR